MPVGVAPSMTSIHEKISGSGNPASHIASRKNATLDDSGIPTTETRTYSLTEINGPYSSAFSCSETSANGNCFFNCAITASDM